MLVVFDHLPISSWAKSAIGARATHPYVCAYQEDIHLTKQAVCKRGNHLRTGRPTHVRTVGEQAGDQKSASDEPNSRVERRR